MLYTKEIINLLDTTYMEVNNTPNSVKDSLKILTSLTIGEYILHKNITRSKASKVFLDELKYY
jgi:hypothetical protein